MKATEIHTQAEAESALQALLDARQAGLVVLADATREFPWGWMCTYQTRRFALTHAPLDSIAGNGPVFIERSGRFIETGSAHSAAAYLAAYQQTGDPNAILEAVPTEVVVLLPASAQPRNSKAISLLRKAVGVGLSEAMRLLDSAAVGQDARLPPVATPRLASELVTELAEAGVRAAQVAACRGHELLLPATIPEEA